jgi:hypothetical protein
MNVSELSEAVFLAWQCMGGPAYREWFAHRNDIPKGPSLWYGHERGWEPVKEKK